MSPPQPSKLDQLFPELLSRIIYFVDNEDLKQLRLTNKSLDAYAKKQLFRSVFLSPAVQVLKEWGCMLDDSELCSFAQKVIIQSAKSIDGDSDSSDNGYDSDEETDFSRAVQELTKLKNVNSIQINFKPMCVGIEKEHRHYIDGVETIATRLKVLELVFRAIRKRAINGDAVTVRELTIQNLQNRPTEFPLSDLFYSVMGKLDHLHLTVVQEYNENGPDHDYSRKELLTFPPHLISQWITPISQNLKALSLYAESDNWGPFPGYYDFSAASFPQLETLSLGYYAIAYDNQLDWILAQKSLKKLVMVNCMIASDIRIYQEDMETWGVSTRNWDVVPDADPILLATCARYSGTWGHFFDKMADSLQNLELFRFDYQEGDEYSIVNRDMAGVELHPKRYVVFDEGILPTRWPEAGNDGRLRYTFWEDMKMIRNFHEDNLHEDQRGLDKLVKKCRERATM